MDAKLIAFNGRYIHSCLALYYLREELHRHLPGFEMELNQFTINDPYYATLQKICRDQPRLLFFSSYIWNSALLERLLTDLPLILPETRLVIGGPQAGVLSRLPLPETCTFVLGEIEGIEPDFYHDLKHLSPKRIYQCRPATDFPSPYHDSDLLSDLAKRHIYYESTRGCPFACSYCLSSISRGVRRKELDQVKAELTRILAHGPRLIKFVDRTFNADPERTLAIWRFLAETGGETLFHFEMAPDLFTEEMFTFLATLPPGHFQFELGIQSTNQETLKAVNRVMDLAKVGENIRRLAALDTIHLHADLILGLPRETETSFRQAINEVFAMAPHHIQMGLLKVLPDTPIHTTQGLSSCQRPPYEILATDRLTPVTIAQLFWLGETIEAFHNNRYFPTLFHYLREQQEPADLFFEGLLAVCLHHDFFSQSPTQELLNRMLVNHAGLRADTELIHEFLAFDWLHYGHRFLPNHLPPRDFATTRQRMKRILGQNLPPLFDHRNRDEFFKQGLFAEFSAESLSFTSIEHQGRSGVVCFRPERQPGIHPYQQTLFFPL
ncbi:MAG: radical SAM protein [Proteobacteria bacterium]|nr:radical SAM protein [Pseudomonadota bacterium]MBU1688577.1 radical SAM protein [Pseudomonadota bacterium]